MDDYLDKVAVPQIKELLSNYGPGVPAVLWFDTPVAMNTERAEKILPVLKMQPDLIVNNRLDSKKRTGDFETPEQKIPATGIPGKDWETCMTMNHTWGFKKNDNGWKSAEMLVTNLVDIASKGGNFLLNVGPNSLGEIPQPSVERLAEVGKWMDVNGEAIYGTTASPFSQGQTWGRCTKKVDENGDTTLYLHVFDGSWPADGKLFVLGLENKVIKAYCLKPGWFGSHKELKATPDPKGTGVYVSVPKTAPDQFSSTIVLKIKGTPKIWLED
jgi:alpha-L-fucosidase